VKNLGAKKIATTTDAQRSVIFALHEIVAEKPAEQSP
jgi:hypothetical protein